MRVAQQALPAFDGGPRSAPEWLARMLVAVWLGLVTCGPTWAGGLVWGDPLPELASQEDPPQEAPPQEAPPQEDPPQEDPPKESPGQDDPAPNERVGERLLKRALAAGNRAEIARAVGILGQADTPGAVAMILKVGESYPEDPVADAVTQALAGVRSRESIAYLGAQLGQARTLPRALLLIETLWRIDDPGTIAPLLAALDEGRDGTTLLSVVRALSTKPHDTVVDALIRFYKKVAARPDTLWAEVRVALHALTGEQHVSHEDWEKWWEITRDHWEPARHGGDAALTAVYRPGGRAALNLPQLFGQEIASTRIVFVVDTSQSMEKIDESAHEEGATGGGRTRLERAQAELCAVLRQLRPEVQFNIVRYSTEARLWKGKALVPATSAHKDLAVRHVGEWEPGGHTNTLEAVLMALAVPNVDTVIVLSDGSPTVPGKGVIADLPPILAEVRAANRFKRVTIHTLGFTGANVSFMKTLARENHGTYAAVR